MSKRVIGLVVAVAVAIVAALVVVQLVGGDDGPSNTAFEETRPEITELLQGIPQDGQVLGNPDAPVTIVEYIDYKCPFCAEASKGVVRELITKYVRPGDVKMELRPIRLGAQGGGAGRLGPDSERGAFAGYAAGEQDKMWDFSEILLANQGDENSEWITDDVVNGVAETIGLDMDKFQADFSGDAVVDKLFASEQAAASDNYTGTPFFVVTSGGRRQAVEASGDIAAFDQAIQQVRGRQ